MKSNIFSGQSRTVLMIAFASLMALAGVKAQAEQNGQAACESSLLAPTSLAQGAFLEEEMAKFLALSTEVKTRLGEASVREILLDDARPILRRKLHALLAQATPEWSVGDLDEYLKGTLELRVPLSQTQQRIEALNGGDVGALRRALGQKTLSEMQLLVYGSDPQHPSADSLVGQYIAETSAASVLRQFPNGPTPEEGLGENRLAVRVTPNQAAVFLKYFDFPELMMHFHTANQGTLEIYFDKGLWNYAGEGVRAGTVKHFMHTDTLLPIILLSGDEAERTRNYFQLGQIDQHLSKYPWNLTGYCAQGGYVSCTHWFGEMPIGEELVSTYSFPGKVDEHATNRQVQSAEPQVAALTAYWDSPEYANVVSQWISGKTVSVDSNNLAVDPALAKVTRENSEDVIKRLVRLVWRTPGHQPLADMLGQEAAKLRGEFANPGYIAHVLTGRVSRERVPVVFIVEGAEDGAELSPDFSLNIHAY